MQNNVDKKDGVIFFSDLNGNSEEISIKAENGGIEYFLYQSDIESLIKNLNDVFDYLELAYKRNADVVGIITDLVNENYTALPGKIGLKATASLAAKATQQTLDPVLNSIKSFFGKSATTIPTNNILDSATELSKFFNMLIEKPNIVKIVLIKKLSQNKDFLDFLKTRVTPFIKIILNFDEIGDEKYKKLSQLLDAIQKKLAKNSLETIGMEVLKKILLNKDLSDITQSVLKMLIENTELLSNVINDNYEFDITNFINAFPPYPQ